VITIPLVIVLLMTLPRLAIADSVDDLVSQLKSSPDYKVRLSAALALSKLSDPRSIPAFVGALKDGDKTVRGVAAASLAKVVTSKTPESTRKKVLNALQASSEKDENAFVREQARKAYDTLRDIDAPVTTGGPYVDVGTMTANGGADLRPLMRKTVISTLKSKDASLRLSWPSGKSPSKQELGQTPAFHVDGTLTELSVAKKGGRSVVSCKVNMLIATYPDKSMFGFLKGGASVETSSSERETKLASEDCVAAVVEDLVGNKIIPTIRSRAR
jgi:hypothetical protein